MYSLFNYLILFKKKFLKKYFKISAYVDNEFDVAALMEEAESKQAALDQVRQIFPFYHLNPQGNHC